MQKRMVKSPVSLIFIVAFTCLAEGQDPRLSLFDQYNHSTSYDDVRPLVSGVLAQQYTFVASHDPQRLPSLLGQQQLTSYRPRIVEIDNATSFLVLEGITSKFSRDTAAQAYLVSKDASGRWTLANRLMPDSVIKTLWTTRFAPADFVQPSSCSIDGTDIRPQSALAIRTGQSIEVSLYPFRFSDADLDYWRQISGIPVSDNSAAGNHFSDRHTPVCRLIVKIDTAGRLSLLNVGFNDQKGGLTRSTLWQPPKAAVSLLALEGRRVHLATAGGFGTDTDGIRWTVSIDIPIWEKGL